MAAGKGFSYELLSPRVVSCVAGFTTPALPGCQKRCRMHSLATGNRFGHMRLLGCKDMHCHHPRPAGEGFSYEVPSRAKGNQLYVQELDRIVLKDSKSHRPFASTATCRKAVITTRILQLVHELCSKRIHVTKRDLFYTDVKLFEVRQIAGVGSQGRTSLKQHWHCHTCLVSGGRS